jgi:hypothetical protein
MDETFEERLARTNPASEAHRFEKTLAEEKVAEEDAKEKRMSKAYEILLREIIRKGGFDIQINIWGPSDNPSQINMTIYNPKESGRVYARVTRQPYFVKQEHQTPKGVIAEMTITNPTGKFMQAIYSFIDKYEEIFHEKFSVKT